MPRLRRTNPGQPGITRRRRGRGFTYHDAKGRVVDDPEIRSRIDDLVIPPAWQQVWITPYANGHLQAVGTDVAGRRQYMYHLDWQRNQGNLKHGRVLQLGAALPKARSVVAEHLDQSGLTRERVLATAFRLLDCGHFRIGGEVYAEANGSFGLSTLRREHVHRQGDELVFEYIAKSGLARVERIDDEILLDVVSSLRRRRGGDVDELLVYRDGKQWHRATSAEINAYVKDVLGLQISAKDFRTWHGTVLGAVAVADESLRHPKDTVWSKTAQDKAIRRAVVAVAENLGNTPTVCRGSYINPRVIELFREGVTIDRAVSRLQRDRAGGKEPDQLDRDSLVTIGRAPTVERAVLKMLDD